MEEKLSTCESSIAAVSVVIALIATMTGPRLDHGMTRDRLVAANVRKTRQITGLQTALRTAQSNGRALETELTGVSLALEKALAELTELKAERDALATQVTTFTEKTRQLECQMAALGEEASKLKELLSLHELSKERDAAMARAQKAEERIRELTLELHRSGVWP